MGFTLSKPFVGWQPMPADINFSSRFLRLQNTAEATIFSHNLSRFLAPALVLVESCCQRLFPPCASGHCACGVHRPSWEAILGTLPYLWNPGILVLIKPAQDDAADLSFEVDAPCHYFSLRHVHTESFSSIKLI